MYSPRKHGVENNAEGPDIAGGVITLPGKNFRGHEVGSIERGHQKTVLCSKLLGKAKITNTQRFGGRRFRGVHDIGRLQITMDHL